MEDGRLKLIPIQYKFYYYNSEGILLLNFKSFFVFGLAVVAPLMIMSVEQLIIDSNYLGFVITTIIFIIILFTIRKLNSPTPIKVIE